MGGALSGDRKPDEKVVAMVRNVGVFIAQR